MKHLIFSSLFFFAVLFFTACKDNPVEVIHQPTSSLDENARIKKIIEANITKKNSARNARTINSATWYFSPYGFQHTGSASVYSSSGSVYVNNGNAYPIVLSVCGQLAISSASLSCSGTCMQDDYVDGDGYPGQKLILGAGTSATFSFTATVSNAEGFLRIEQISPTYVSSITYSDDWYYLIRGI